MVRLLPQVEEYIAKQTDPLWEGIRTDATQFPVESYAKRKSMSRWGTLMKPLNALGEMLSYRTLNFVKRKDGTLVWIDPLKFLPILSN